MWLGYDADGDYTFRDVEHFIGNWATNDFKVTMNQRVYFNSMCTEEWCGVP